VKAMLKSGTTTQMSAVPEPRRRSRLKMIAVGAAVAVLVPFGAGMASVPSWGNPFEQRVVDRSPAPLITALRDVAQYRAASGTFQVLVDLEHDTPNIPSFISGDRTTFFATGHVDGIVDFSALGDDRVVVSPDRLFVTITLPAPVLEPAVVDPVQSRIVGQERGVIDRITDVLESTPPSQAELYLLAGQKLDAAAATSDLPARTEQNTRNMLTTLARSLGFQQVNVIFEPADRR
jgi:hypothetical protein